MAMQTFSGADYLRIDIANSFGHGDKLWSERIKWTLDNEERLQALAVDKKALAKMDEPCRFYAGVQAYFRAKRGLPIGYNVALDATASGIQALCMLVADGVGAESCNAIDNGKRNKAYMKVAKFMNDTKITAKAVKNAVMTAFYNSTAIPEGYLGKGTPAIEKFWEALGTIFPDAWKLVQYLKDNWDGQAERYDWTLPDGFEAHFTVEDLVKFTVEFLGETHTVEEMVRIVKDTGRQLCPNLVHSVDAMVARELVRRCMWSQEMVDRAYSLIAEAPRGKSTCRQRDKDLIRLLGLARKQQFYSIRIFDYLDVKNYGLLTSEDIVELSDSLGTISAKPFELLVVHDCFNCHANNMNDVRRIYARLLSEIARSDILRSLLEDTVPNFKGGATKRSPELYLEVEHANYALS